MLANVLNSMDPRLLGQRLRNVRKLHGMTQQEVSESLEVTRTTITALEKGNRRVRPDELVQLARLYGRQVGDLVGSRPATGDFTIQLRPAVAQAQAFHTEKELEQAIQAFRMLCENYLYLEDLNGSLLVRNYPEPYAIDGVSPEDAAEDITASERNRLGLGDGPILNLRDTLESDVGIRIFCMELPARVAGIYVFTDELGACIAVNSCHPEAQQRWDLAREYGHFLTRRYESDITVVAGYQRMPASERFGDSFARAFLMPATGLKRRFHQATRSAGGKVTATDICRLSNFFRVSCAAMMLRLEGLRLVARGTWEGWQDRGFAMGMTQEHPGLEPVPDAFAKVSFRYQLLAAQAFAEAKLTEGELARLLGVDRVTARRVVQRLEPTLSLPDDSGEEALTTTFTRSIRRIPGRVKAVL